MLQLLLNRVQGYLNDPLGNLYMAPYTKGLKEIVGVFLFTVKG